MRNYRRMQEQAKAKADNRLKLALESQLPMDELVSRAREGLEGFATRQPARFRLAHAKHWLYAKSSVLY